MNKVEAVVNTGNYAGVTFEAHFNEKCIHPTEKAGDHKTYAFDLHLKPNDKLIFIVQIQNRDNPKDKVVMGNINLRLLIDGKEVREETEFQRDAYPMVLRIDYVV